LGAAGEHFILSQLLLMGFTACLAPEGAKGIDVVITDSEGVAFAALQVKSKLGRQGEPWRLTPKAEVLSSPSLWYAFVGFSKDSSFGVQELYIVPSEEVRRIVSGRHRQWLNTPGRNGQAHNENTVRLFDIKRFDLGGEHYDDDWAQKYARNWTPIAELIGHEPSSPKGV